MIRILTWNEGPHEMSRKTNSIRERMNRRIGIEKKIIHVKLFTNHMELE